MKKYIKWIVIGFVVLCLFAGGGDNSADTKTSDNQKEQQQAEVSKEEGKQESKPEASKPEETEKQETTQKPTETQKPEKQEEAKPVALSSIPAYSGKAYVVINNNQPSFSESELKTSGYETYSGLDSLGRCGMAIAAVGKDTMPKANEERGSISSIKPTGWQQATYDNISGKYLYNRCHLIGWQLSAENANRGNLITGTKYLNVEGMLPFENMVADYIKETGNHVAYRIVPIYEGNNLLASGVQMEAYSIEDKGEGICFNVYCYNVQPGITIDYATGKSTGPATEQNNNAVQNTTTQETNKEVQVWIPASGKKYHSKNNCGTMNPDKASQVTKQMAESKGYTACKNCY